jgi:CspA family cold shock protein
LEWSSKLQECHVVNGTVKWFDEKKGYGFITVDGGKDAFVHHSNIEGTGFKTLAEGQRVSLVVTQGTKGPQAEQVRVITE